MGARKPNDAISAGSRVRMHDRFAVRKVSELVPYAQNSRTHSPEQVAKIAGSIRAFGFANPVLVDEEGTIIAGHGRVMAANQLGMVEVPTITLTGLTETERRQYVIADNRLALDAGWDEAMLALELKAIELDGGSLALTGFDEGEILALGVGAEETQYPELDSGEKEPFQGMTFTLHDTQAEVVREALNRAKESGPFDGPNENSNGNALARVCEAYLGR